MAPSTPPPPSKLRFAALTMASTASVVMSATQTSSRAGPMAALTSGAIESGAAMSANLSRPLGLRLGPQIDRALHADIVEVLVEKAPRRALAADMEHVEKIVIGRKPAESVKLCAEPIEHDSVNVDAPILSRTDAAWQLVMIDQARHEDDRAVFADHRRVERDFVDAIHDLARRRRR